MPRKFQTGATLMLSKQIFGANAPIQCEALLFLAHLRRLSRYPFGSEGKGLERETLCPFPRLRRFGTHSETGSKFLLLFSIKSKKEILCFAEKVPNGRNTHVVQANFWRECAHPVRSTAILGAPRRFSPCRFRHGGEGIGKGNFVALSSVAEVWNPFRNGFQVFVTF